jgi:ribonuclease HI
MKNFLNGGKMIEQKNKEELKIDENIQVYVDGSYHKDKNLTGAGVVVLYKENVYKKSFTVPTEEHHSWNIDGECHAVLEALRICSGETPIDNAKIVAKNITINYDYTGIEK